MPSRRFSVYHFTQCRMRFWFSLHCSIVGIICWKKKVRHSRGMFCSGFKVLEIVLLPFKNKIVFLSSLKCTHTHKMKTFYSEVGSITFDAVSIWFWLKNSVDENRPAKLTPWNAMKMNPWLHAQAHHEQIHQRQQEHYYCNKIWQASWLAWFETISMASYRRSSFNLKAGRKFCLLFSLGREPNNFQKKAELFLDKEPNYF